MNDKELYDKELFYLRDELITLKNCQVNFVGLTITGTSLLLGLFGLKSASLPGIFALFPLVIILPAWWIFFEKSKTITRIQGYIRILERIMLGKSKVNFKGWENSQCVYRKREQEGIFKKYSEEIRKSFWKKLKDLLTLKSSPYWMEVYYTFLLLSSLCLFLYCVLSNYNIKIIIFVALIGIIPSVAINFLIVLELVWGRYSPSSNEKIWEDILSEREITFNPAYG